MENEILEKKHSVSECAQYVLPIRDCLDIISGKWKLPIMAVLLEGKKRFTEMARMIPNITPRMLSKELKELELNEFVTRTVYATSPVTVEYALTKYSQSLNNIIAEMREWGFQHRKRLMNSSRKKKKELVEG